MLIGGQMESLVIKRGQTVSLVVKQDPWWSNGNLSGQTEYIGLDPYTEQAPQRVEGAYWGIGKQQLQRMGQGWAGSCRSTDSEFRLGISGWTARGGERRQGRDTVGKGT
jgi:hypothetical protein